MWKSSNATFRSEAVFVDSGLTGQRDEGAEEPRRGIGILPMFSSTAGILSASDSGVRAAKNHRRDADAAGGGTHALQTRNFSRTLYMSVRRSKRHQPQSQR